MKKAATPATVLNPSRYLAFADAASAGLDRGFRHLARRRGCHHAGAAGRWKR